MRPLLGCNTPERILSKVDLPQPEGPTTLRNERGAMSNEASCKAVTGPLPVLKTTERFSIVIPGAPLIHCPLHFGPPRYADSQFVTTVCDHSFACQHAAR